MAWTDHERLAAALFPAVVEAGRVEMGYFRSNVAVLRKGDDSPVTAADHEAEAILIDALDRAAPGIPVVAEEQAAAGVIPDVGTLFFLVDPLDGTKEFVAGRDEFTINIGLVEDRRPVFGFIYAPAMERMFVTIGGKLAVEARVDPKSDAAYNSLAWATIRSREPATDGLTALQSRTVNPRGEAFLADLPVKEGRRLGSSIKFCLIARGDADVYGRIGPTSEWDTAAGHAILAAAGGSVTNLAGEDLSYGHAERRFTNPEFVAWGRKPLDFKA